MERENYLIDSNIAIYFGMTLSGKFAVSVINRIELLGFGNLRKRKSELSKLLLTGQFNTIDESVILKTIQIRKEYNINCPMPLLPQHVLFLIAR